MPPMPAAPSLNNGWPIFTGAFLSQAFALRLVLWPMAASISSLAAWNLEQGRLRPYLLATTVIFELVYVVDWLVARGSQPTRGGLAVRMALTFVPIAVMMVATGGISSPLILALFPPSLMAGLQPPRSGLRYAMWVFPSLLLLLLGIVAAGGLGAVGRWTGLVEVFPHNYLPHTAERSLLVAAMIMAAAQIGIRLRRMLESLVSEVEDARRAALDDVVQRNRDLVSTTGVIAHELKNPLASIQGLGQLLARETPEGSQTRERLDVMLREISRMRNVLDEFRNFTRPLSTLHLKETDAASLVHDVLSLHEGLAAQRRAELVSTVEPALRLRCDASKLRQALTNLVQNALEAVSGQGRVEVTVQRDGDGFLRFAVLDDGPGLPDAMLQDRPATGFSTKDKGSGIGLSIVRSIVQQHGGTLTLARRAPRGTGASFRVPVEPSVQEDSSW